MSKNGKSPNGNLLAPSAIFTAKQRLFIHYYVNTLNATQSARLAGYKGKLSTLAVVGSDNLRKTKIREEIDRQLHARLMTPDEVLNRLGSQAKAEYTEFMTPQGVLDLAKLIKAGKGHLIKKIKRSPVTGNITEIEFYDAQTALTQVGKYFKLWTDKVEQDTTITLIKGYEEVTPDDWDNVNENETESLGP